MSIRRTLLVALVFSVGIAHAATSDFVFGEDFDSSIPCPVGPGTSIAAAITPASRSTRLGTANYFLVKVLSCGYAGTVNLGASGAPANWTLSVDPPSFSLASGQLKVALVNAAIPTNGDSGFVTFGVTAQASSNTVPLSANVDAANEILIVISDGTGSDQALHPFQQGWYMRVGTKVRILSDDSTDGHIIHATGVTGFSHMNTAGPGLLQGQEYDQTPTSSGSAELYCHNHGPVRTLTVQP